MGTPPRGATRHGVEATPPAPGRAGPCPAGVPGAGRPPAQPRSPRGHGPRHHHGQQRRSRVGLSQPRPRPPPWASAFPAGVIGFAPEAHVSGQGWQAASSGFICDHDRPPVPVTGVTGPPGWTTARGGGQTPRPDLRRSLAVCRRRAQWSRHDKGAAAGRRMPALQGLAFRRKRKSDAGRALNRKQRTQGFVIN